MENSAFDLEQAFGLSDLGEILTTAPTAEPVVASTESPETISVSPKPKNSRILHELLVQPMAQLSTVLDVVKHPQQSQQTTDVDLLDYVTEEKDDRVTEGILSLLDRNTNTVCVEYIQSEICLGTDIQMHRDELNESVESNDSIIEQFIKSPLSVDEVENFLSVSEPGSPEQLNNDDPDYIPDYSDEYTPSKKSKLSSGKAKKSRVMVEPYEIPTEGLSKKERKKVQNRNAAIRYRMKKRGEKIVVKTDEETLVEKNQELHDKVDTISREIKYMKDLMTEVFQAKGLKISFK